MLRKVVFLMIALGIVSVVAVAQEAAKPCALPQTKQFDFWVGEWNLEWKTPNGEVRKGKNIVTKILDGCVVMENFDGGESLPLKGISHSMFNAPSGKWKQTWVDNSGSYLDFSGGMEGDKMILARSFTRKDGKMSHQRMVFFDITENSLNWNWEYSSDNGKTWVLAWNIKYTKTKIRKTNETEKIVGEPWVKQVPFFVGLRSMKPRQIS